MQHNIHGGDIYSDLIEYDFSVNTNPLDCTEIHKAISKCIGKNLSNYPDPEQREFRAAVAQIENVPIANVWGSNGASEAFTGIISMLKPGKVLLTDPCFAGYRHALSMGENCFVESYLLKEDKDFAIDRDFVEYIKRKATEGLDLIIIANPNNPTGKNISEEMVKEIFETCKYNNIKIIVDECFIRMSEGAQSMVPYIDEYDGLYVVNAFTKLFSIPGLRVGYTISQAKNISELKKYLPEWNMSVIAQESGIICRDYLLRSDFVQDTVRLIKKEREYLVKELKKLGLKVWDSDTGFILFYSKKRCLKENLIKKRILIRDCSDYEGLGKGYYRVAVKNRSQNINLVSELKELL